jgi:hypothetical protein
MDERLLRGSPLPDREGVVRGAALVESDDGFVVPTPKGRLFIEEQRAFFRGKTLFGRIKANWPLFSGIIGIIVGWSLGLVSPLIQQRLHTTASERSAAPPQIGSTASPSPTATVSAP